MGESNVTQSDCIYLDFMLIFLFGMILQRNASQDIFRRVRKIAKSDY